ncbi:MAG: hypothetical protein C4343_05380 [Chloroflexota bacterium]
MYLDGLSFLEDERDAWRPFEALDALSDEALSRPVAAAHGWSGRDLMAQLVAWQEIALAVARELAVGGTSPTLERVVAEWETGGAAMNERLLREWAALPLDEVRRRFRTVPGELRGTLTVVPEARWVKHDRHRSALLGATLDHYADHEADLAAILAASGVAGS